MPSTAWVEAWIPSTSQGDDRVNVEPSLFKRSEEHTSELQSRLHVVCRLLLEQKKTSHRTGLRRSSRLTLTTSPRSWPGPTSSLHTNDKPRPPSRTGCCA